VADQVRLCDVVQGVEFVVVEQGVRIRALILRDALEQFYGAGASPESWLQAYLRHQDAIDCAAADRHRANPLQALVVLQADAPDNFDPRAWPSRLRNLHEL
jgi:hypothetical protein